jgi:hypothetical protein
MKDMVRRRRRSRGPFFALVNLKVLAGALVTASFLVICSLTGLWITRPGPSAAGAATAVFNVISAPSDTQIPMTTTLTNEPGALPSTPPPPPAGEIGIGAYVQVSGTAGTGLRLRSEAGLNSNVLLLAAEAEVFRIQDGPRDVDGYTWWYLVGPCSQTRTGGQSLIIWWLFKP